MKYDNFVFYGSWRESLEGFKEDFGEEYAKEVLWNIMTASTAGDVSTEKKSILGFISGSVMPNINKAKERYKAAVENGKKGGRPAIELNEAEVLKKKEELKTWKAVAAFYQITEQTLKNKRKDWELQKNEKNPKNLDSDIYIYNYNYKDKESYKDKDKNIEEDKYIEGKNEKNPKNQNTKEEEFIYWDEENYPEIKFTTLDERDFFEFEVVCCENDCDREEAIQKAYQIVLDNRLISWDK